MIRKRRRPPLRRIRLQFALHTLLAIVTAVAALLAVWRQMCHPPSFPQAYLIMASTGVLAALAPVAVAVLAKEPGRAADLTIRLACYGLVPLAWWLLLVCVLLGG
jgi:hypothetical protein